MICERCDNKVLVEDLDGKMCMKCGWHSWEHAVDNSRFSVITEDKSILLRDLYKPWRS